jgi:transcriptional regulator of heat shock response
MSTWSKEDRGAFNRSEVMTEFEKKIIEATHALNEKLQARASLEEKTKKVDELTQKVENLNKQLTQMSSANDGFLENYLDADLVQVEGSQDVPEEEKEEMEQEMSQEELVNDLEAVAQRAISEGQYKIAYDIERTIREILDGE